MASKDLRDRIAATVGDEPTGLDELDGGQVGTVYRVAFADRSPLVAKVGDLPLSVEAKMLRHLATESDLPVPAVRHADDDLLLLEHVDGESRITPAVERDAAGHLAALHGATAPAFGFAFDTLTGPLRQPNPWTDSWVAFFREHRVEYLADVAREAGALPDSLHGRVADLAADLDELLVEPDAPALVHGDVWTENVLARDGRVAAFLDPAAYYAHAEVDLAYVDWTDTFGEPFFERYRELRPVAEGFFERRRHVYAVAPLLVHCWYFGEEYVPELAETLERLGY